MNTRNTIVFSLALVLAFMSGNVFAQSNGDFRSQADGSWSANGTWETFDGSNWNAASSVPTGSETIWINGGDSVDVDGSVTISGSGHVIVQDTSELTASGTLEFGSESTYEHDRDGGSVPVATWSTGSTILFSGIVGDGPDNRDQAFHNITWNNPGQASNISLGLGTVTITGDVRVVNSGGSRFRLTDSGSGDGQTLTIEGDLIVESGAAVETTGSSSEAVYNVVVMGDVIVNNDATFATSRGSGGRATWTIHGNFSARGEAELRDSHDGDSSRVIFGGSSLQNISIDEAVSYNGAMNFTISSGSQAAVPADSTFHFEDDFQLNGTLTVNGTLSARDTVHVDGGTMTVADGGTYNHDHDAGEIPTATWADGSTVLLTGIETNDPDNGDQSFFNYTWDNAGQIENINIGWDGYTLRGNMTVLNTNGNQFRMTSAGDTTRVITIEGNVVVDGESAEFTATGSGDIADYDITVMGDVSVLNGGFLSVSRGSGGRAVWTLYGDMTIDGGEIGDSDIDKHGQTRSFVFAADTASDGVPGQTITASNVSYDSEVYFEIADSSGVMLAAGSDFAYEGVFTNYGVFDVDGDATLTFTGESTYNHARDGGNVPTATWAEGSTALFTGIETEGPGNASQDYFHLVLDSPNNIENNHLDMDGNTIYGDIDVLNTGSARLYLTNPDTEEDRVITIMGDVYVDAEGGAFSTQGTGSGLSSVTVHHYGGIYVDNGNFSIGRGSGPIVHWYLYGGDFIFNAGETQNSNPRAGSAFIFAGADTTYQTMTVSSDVDISHLPVVVDTGATLDIGTSSFAESGDDFTVRAGATLASADTSGFDSNLELGGSGETTLTLSTEANYILNGSEHQQTGFRLPLIVNDLTIDNSAGVTQTRLITINGILTLSAGVFDNTVGFTLGAEGAIEYNGGSLLIPVDDSGNPIEFPMPPYEEGDVINYNGSFAEADLGEASNLTSWFLASDGGTYTIVEESQDDDNRALQFELNTYNGSGNDWENEAVNENYTIAVGDMYEVSIYAKADADTRVANFYLGLPAEGNWARPVETQETLSTEWTEYVYQYTATEADTVGMRFSTAMNFEANEGGTIWIDNLTVTKVGVVSNEPVDEVPDKFALRQNYPNPFNPTTTINYDVPEQTHVSLKIYNVMGQEVAELVNDTKSPGSYSQVWNAQRLASGVYFYRIVAGDFTAVRKLTLMK